MAEPSLERAIGPVATTLLVIGSVIGSGIFLTTGVMAATLPSAALLLVAWVAGGIFALAGALTYAELGAMFPRSGGVYVYLREAFGPLVGFLYGWASLLVMLSGGIAAVAVGFADSFSYFFPALSVTRTVFSIPVAGQTWTVSAAQLTAATSILILGGVNYVGVRSGSRTNAVLTIAKVTGLLLLIVFAIWKRPDSADFGTIVPPGLETPIATFGIVMIAVLWAYDGYYFMTYASGEVQNPVRTIPRALTIGLLTVITIYVSVNIVYLIALPMDELRGATRVAERAAASLAGQTGATVVAASVVISTLGANAAILLSGPRLFFAMAVDGMFFKRVAAVHPTYRTPHVSIAMLTIWSAALALTGSYEQLFTYVVFISVMFSLLGALALFRLRRTRPAAERPYRVWGYPVVPAIFALGGLLMIVNTLQERPVQSLAGFGLLALGLPAYLYWKRSPRAERDRGSGGTKSPGS